MDAQLLDRIGAALDAGAATPTPELTALLIEAGGEQCWQRARLLHRLRAILHAKRPPMSHSTTHRFKADFASRIKSGLASGPILDDRIITPDNLTDEDVPLLVQYGYGHLIEELPKAKKPAEPEPEKPSKPAKDEKNK